MHRTTSVGIRRKAGYLAIIVGLAASLAWHGAQAEHCHVDEVLLATRVETEGNTVYQVDTCMKGSGPWAREELDALNGVLTGLPDTLERKWVMGHVAVIREHERPHTPGMADPPISARPGKLIVRDGFFALDIEVQKSLLAFEAGKAFYARYKLDPWFARHMTPYGPLLLEMVSAGKAPEEPNSDMYDGASQFGGMFRVRMLKLPAKSKWKAALREFDKLMVRYASPDAP